MPVSESIHSNITHLSLSEGALSLSSQSSASPGMEDLQPVLLELAVKGLPEQQVQAVPGIKGWFQPVQELSIEDRVSRTQYQFSLTTPDQDVLNQWLPDLVEVLQQRPELSEVAHDLQQQGLQAYIDIDRTAAARLGINVSQISTVLQSAYSQRQITTLFTQANQYRVVLEVDPDYAQGIAALQNTYVATSNGTPVLLSTIATISQRPAPLLINNQEQFPSTTFSFNLGDKASLGEAIAAIEAVEAEIAMPATLELRFQGAAEAFRASLSSTLLLILAAIITITTISMAVACAPSASSGKASSAATQQQAGL